MKSIDQLLIGKDLKQSESKQLFRHFLAGSFQPETAKQSLALLQKKGEHSDELTGLVEAVRSLEQPISTKARFLVDGCGTGGDGKHTFNISTLACLIAGAAGAQVAKHGNRSISSRCGSSDLMESLGVHINAPRNRMLKALRTVNFGYFHAPLYHPIFKQVQPIRAELAKKRIKTIFNLAGPFLNPLRPKQQLIGVWKKDLVRMMAKTAQNLKLKHVIVIWNTGGLDEMTTNRNVYAIELRGRRLTSITFGSKQFRLKRNAPKDLKGGSVRQNRDIALRILSARDKSPRLDVVLLNAGTILYLSGKTKSISDGVRLARQAVYSQSAFRLLKQLVRLSHGSR